MQIPPWQRPGSSWHSSISGGEFSPLRSYAPCVTVAAAGERTVTFQDDGDGVGPEALPSRTQSLVFRCGPSRGVSVNVHFRQRRRDLGLLALQELLGGHSSQGFPQAPPREQQQEARVTPTPISRLQESPPSPRVLVSRKQLPTRVSERGSCHRHPEQQRHSTLTFRSVGMFENQSNFFHVSRYIFFI